MIDQQTHHRRGSGVDGQLRQGHADQLAVFGHPIERQADVAELAEASTGNGQKNQAMIPANGQDGLGAHRRMNGALDPAAISAALANDGIEDGLFALVAG